MNIPAILLSAANDERRQLQRQEMIRQAAMPFSVWRAYLIQQAAQRQAQLKENRRRCGCGKSRCRGWCKS